MMKIKKRFLLVLTAIVMLLSAATYVYASHPTYGIISPNQATETIYMCGSGCVTWGAQTKVVNTDGFETSNTAAVLERNVNGDWQHYTSFTSGSTQTNVWLGQVKTSYVPSGKLHS